MREQVRCFTPIVAVLALLTALALACTAQAEWVWDGDLGWIDMSQRPVESDRGLFAYATGRFISGDYAAAADVFRGVEKRFPESPFAIKARFGRAKCLLHLGKPAEAAKLCDELLAAKPDSLRREELHAFIMELAPKLKDFDPARAEDLLARLVGSQPAGKAQYDAVLALADAARRQGDYDTVRSSLEKAAALASDPEAKCDATFRSAVNDVAESRERGHSEALIQQAETTFRELLNASPKGPRAKEAREYLEVLDGLLGVGKPYEGGPPRPKREKNDESQHSDREKHQSQTPPGEKPDEKAEKVKVPEADRRAVYYDVTRLLEPGYSGDSSVFKRAAKRFHSTDVGETARYYQAECLYRQGKLWPAFDVYEQFLEEYAASNRRRTVVEREYVIGQALEDQHERSRAQDVMEAVSHNAADGPLADDALMFVGRAQLDNERFEDARTTFDLVAEGYPKSKWNRAAIFLSGVSDLRHSRFVPDNEMILDRAQRAFEMYLRDQPDGQFADEAKKLLGECKEKKAQTLVDVAHFYEKRHQPAAAAVYYKMVLEEHPESAGAKAAKSALDRQGGPPVRPDLSDTEPSGPEGPKKENP